MSEVTRADLDAIRQDQRELKDAIAELAAAQKSGNQRRIAAARDDVADAREDLDAELRKRNLTRADLDELAESKEYDRHKARQDRLEAERAAASPPPPAGEPGEGEPGEGEPGEGEPPPAEEPPASQHRFEKRLWGGRKDEG